MIRTTMAALAILSATEAGLGAQSGMLDVGDAVIHYDMAGRGQAIVFLHGWAQDLTIWDEQGPVFAAQYRVVRLDRRGFGKSTGHADPSADPADLIILLESLGIRSALVVGLSAGAGTALRFAVAYPDRVRALVLYGFAGGALADFPGRTPGAGEARGFSEIARKYGLDSLGKAVFSSPLAWTPPDRPWRLDSLPTWWRNYAGRDLLDPKPPSGLVPAPRWDQLPMLRVPTLLVNGDHDIQAALVVADSLERRLPDVRRVVIKDAAPVARDEKILVKLLTPGERDLLKPEDAAAQPPKIGIARDADGKLTWRYDLKPGEKREIPLKFSVEHPADLPVTGVE